MCTGIRLTATDGTVVCARTLAFAVDLMKMNLDAGEIMALSMGGAEPLEPLAA